VSTMNADEVRRHYPDQLSWPDDRLGDWAGSIVGVPKLDPADSFVLHAPLELMARVSLLTTVDPAAKQGARERLVWLVDSYRDAGESVSPPPPVRHASVAEAFSALTAAIGTSDLDEVDRHAHWLGENASVAELRSGLGPIMAPSLAAAAHGSIALHLLNRAPLIGPSLLRGVARETARHPDWLIPWEGLSTGERPVMDALLAAPLLGMPDSSYILPMVMHGADAARDLLAGVSPDPVEARRSLSRVAAWSMIQDDSEHVPYGWTHTLSIPQAVMSLDLQPDMAVSIAASQTVGFRASMGTVVLDPLSPLPRAPSVGPEELAQMASLHSDAHVVKYSLAILDAIAFDPGMSGLYLAAATRLHEWWAGEPSDAFFASSHV
jgi:hypothetical protein